MLRPAVNIVKSVGFEPPKCCNSSRFARGKFQVLMETRQAMYICITWQWGELLQPLLQCKSNKYYYIFWDCVNSLKYPACNPHAPYCHLWPARHHSIFPLYLINGTIFEIFFLNQIMCVLIFFTTFIFYSKKNWVRYDKKCIFVFM